MKKWILLGVAAMLLLASCRWSDAPVAEALTPSNLANWEAEVGPTYGDCNPYSPSFSCNDLPLASAVYAPSYFGYTVLTGDQAISSGSRLNHVLIYGCAYVEEGATDIALTDVFIVVPNVGSLCDGNDSPAPGPAALWVHNATNVAFTDVEVWYSGTYNGEDTTGVGYGNYTCFRCDVHGFTKSFSTTANNVVIRGSVSYDLRSLGGFDHSENVFAMWSQNVVITNNYFVANDVPGVTGNIGINACTGCEPGGGSRISEYITITDNYLLGGDYGKAIDFGDGTNATNMVVTGNVMDEHNSQWWAVNGGATPTGYCATDPAPIACYVHNWNGSATGNVWSGNLDEDGDVIS